jgi:hypothetical protein
MKNVLPPPPYYFYYWAVCSKMERKKPCTYFVCFHYCKVVIIFFFFGGGVIQENPIFQNESMSKYYQKNIHTKLVCLRHNTSSMSKYLLGIGKQLLTKLSLLIVM